MGKLRKVYHSEMAPFFHVSMGPSEVNAENIRFSGWQFVRLHS